MSNALLGRSRDLKRLRDEGYDVDARGAYLLVRDIPYVNAQREVKRGSLVMDLTLAGDVTAPPATHVAHFAGEYPCAADGTPIAAIKNDSTRRDLGNGVAIDHTFSAKPDAPFPDYYEKVAMYVAILSGPAKVIEPSATAQTYPVVERREEDDSPFNYLDTASSRADIGIATQKLTGAKIGIVGLGGTGSYVLDFVAKTPVEQIHLFDDDIFLQHNAFRSPGAPSLDQLRGKPAKVEYWRDLYSRMHRGIVAHVAKASGDAVEELARLSFVFLCLDPGPGKAELIARLSMSTVPFVDTGMGLELVDGSLTGMLRVTTSTAAKRDHVRDVVDMGDDDGPNDYDRNIQVADLNALSAALAVIKWKKICGFYRDVRAEHHAVFTVDGNMLSNSEIP